MDIVAHGLWGGVVFGWRRKFFWAFLFGVLPDLLAFGPYFLYTLITGTLAMGKPEISAVPSFVFISYDISHSLIVAVLLLLLVRFVISKKYAISFLAYPLHILLDIPSHDRAFFPTPFLYPLSDFVIDGIPWSNPYFMAFNYLSLTTAFFLYFRRRSRRKRLNTKDESI
jgi:hypothetical protein